jgi:predicted GTPase
MKKAIVLTDGEHYPAVTHDAIEVLKGELDILAAVFIGGTEKMSGDPVGVPGSTLTSYPAH